MCRLKQLDWISVGIFQLNLFPARPCLHFVSKAQAGLPQRFNSRRQILHLQDYPIPSTRFLLPAIGRAREPDAPGPLRINLRLPAETCPNAGKCWWSNLKPSCCV